MPSRITAVRPLWADRRRPRHHRRRAASPSSPAARGARRRRSRRASPFASSRRADGDRPGRARRRARRRCASTASPGETAFVEVGAPLGDRPAPGRQPGVRSRRQPLRHLQRLARPAGAGVDLPRRAATARASRSSPASSTRRRWRSVPTGSCYVSSRFEGTVYRVDARRIGASRSRPTSASPAAWRSTATATLFVGDRSGTIFRVDATGSATTFATLPASVAAFHLAFGPDGALFVTGADARRRTIRLPRSIADGDGRRPLRPASAGRRGWRSTPRRHAATSSMRWPARAACIGFARLDGRAGAGARRRRAGRRRLRPARRAGRRRSNDTAYRFDVNARGRRRRHAIADSFSVAVDCRDVAG